MTQANNKTKPTEQAVVEFIAKVEDQARRQDAMTLLEMMEKVTGESPKMWGPTIVGFGQYHYKYESGREGDFLAVGFSPRKAAMTVYFADGVSQHEALLQQLGPYKVGKGCLYIKHLSDIDPTVLEQMIKASYTYVMSHKNDMHRAK